MATEKDYCCKQAFTLIDRIVSVMAIFRQSKSTRRR
jgi:hypothetical protein